MTGWAADSAEQYPPYFMAFATRLHYPSWASPALGWPLPADWTEWCRGEMPEGPFFFGFYWGYGSVQWVGPGDADWEVWLLHVYYPQIRLPITFTPGSFAGAAAGTFTGGWPPDLNVEFEIDFAAACSEQVVRGFLDERISPGGDILSYSQESLWLRGAAAKRSVNGGLLWTSNHTRGLTYRVGSQVGLRAPGQRLEFIF